MILRRIRITVSLIVFFLFLLVFLGSVEQATKLSEGLLFFQFVPSFVNFLLAGGAFASLGFIFVALLSLVFGRVYCSGLCPLGTLQDLMIFGYRKVHRGKVRYHYQKPNNIIRYGVLVISLVVAILGSMAFVNLLDPYSLFGRIVSHLVKPLYYFLNNTLVSTLEFFDIYALSPREILQVPYMVLGISLFFFTLITLMVIGYGRMYCSLICPVGTLLGIVSRFSLFRFQIDGDHCKNCDLCVKSCKAGCIDNNGTIDQDRCVACFNCLSACKKSAISYKMISGGPKKSTPDFAKRRLIIGSAITGVSLLALNLPIRSYGKKLIKETNNYPATPPGSRSISHFNETCTACSLCIHVCKTKVLNPAFMEYGMKGILQPVMDFNKGKCAYECNECGKVCPTGAISDLDLNSKKLTKIGSVKLLKDLCITHKKDQDCGACIEVCPSHAVYAVLKNNVRYPEIKPGPCIGCGACQFVCPTKPEKSIIVEAVQVHTVAEEPFFDTNPQIKKLPIDSGDEFPF